MKGKAVFSCLTLTLACVAVSIPMALLAPSDEVAPEAEVAQAVDVTEVPPEAPTEVPSTNIPVFTDTPEPTATTVPTDTPEPTNTPTPVPTDTPEPTPTPDAPIVHIEPITILKDQAGDHFDGIQLSQTQDAWVVGVTEDGNWYEIQLSHRDRRGWVRAEDVELTGGADLETVAIATLEPTPTVTPTPTATPDPRSEYSEIDIRELESYADDHYGEKVKIYGEVFNIRASENYLQMWVQKPGGSSFDTVAVIIGWDDSFEFPDGIYNDTYITVYGLAAGTLEGTNSLGGAIEQPFIVAEIIDQ